MIDDLSRILAASTEFSRDRLHPIDAFGEIRVQHFVHLLDAVHGVTTLAYLANAVAALVRSTVPSLDQYKAVFCPKLGNTLLGKSVADALDLHSGFVRPSALMDRFVETRAPQGAKVILVDDVSSEGRVLLDSVRSAASDGFTVDVAFTVVDRVEGDSAEQLLRHGVRLYSCVRLADEDLVNMLDRLRDADNGL